MPSTLSSPLRALVTRPKEDSADITVALQALGLAVQVEPLLDIVIQRDVVLPMDGVQGLLATSANGVRAFAANNATERSLPVWAVGDATARCAESLGFCHVTSAGGDVESLAALVTVRCDPAQGALLHAAGGVVAGDLSGRLSEAGFDVRRVALYQAETARSLSPALIAALDAKTLDLVLFFSPRTAATFVTLINAAGRAEACRGIDAYGLSRAVADRLAGLPWRSVRTAAEPTQQSLLEVIRSSLDRKEPS